MAFILWRIFGFVIGAADEIAVRCLINEVGKIDRVKTHIGSVIAATVPELVDHSEKKPPD